MHRRKFTFHLDNAVFCLRILGIHVCGPAPRFTKSKHFMSFSITSETRYANYHYYAIVLCMSFKSSRRIFNLYSDLALLRKYRVHYGNDPRVYFSAHARDSSANGIELFHVSSNRPIPSQI